MPHHSHKLTAYRDTGNVWVEFCEWCGYDDDRLQFQCTERFKQPDISSNVVDKIVDTSKEQA